MKTTRNAVAVGVVTILVIVGVYYAVRFVSESTTRSGQYVVWALFPDASGLVAGSRVRIAGIPVGYIESIRLQQYQVDAGVDDQGKPKKSIKVGARVDIAVDGDVALYKNGKALRTVGSMVTGDYLIVLVPGDARKEKLKDGDQIDAVGETGLLGEIDVIAEDIKSVTHNLNQVFGSEEGGRQMGEVLANLRDISKSINKLLEQNSEAFTRTMHNIDAMTADNRPGLREIVENMRQITESLKEFVDRNEGQAGDAVATANATLKDIQGAVQKLDRVLDDVGEVTGGIKEGEGTVGRLLTDDKLIDDVENVVEKAGWKRPETSSTTFTR
jgi:phospholipid/cholesterol/gamma-HCH transport system substrate-binding protein